MKRLLSLALFVCASMCAQNAALLPVPKMQFFDNNGYPLAGGQIYFCVAGASCPGTPQNTYTDSTAGTPNPNPVVLDSAGRAAIWIGANAYKVVAQDSNNNVLWTQDNVSSTAIATSGSLTGANGAALIKYTASGTGAVARTVASKLGESVSLLDYGAACDGVTNDTTAFTTGLAAAQSAGAYLWIPDGKTCLIGAVSTSGNLYLTGRGMLKLYSTSVYPTNFALITVTGGNVDINGPAFDQTGIAGTNPSWSDGTEPISTNGYFVLRVNNSSSVTIQKTTWQNVLRGILVYNSSNIDISNNFANLAGSITQNLIALDTDSNWSVKNNHFNGDVWTSHPTSYSVNGLLGYESPMGSVENNEFHGLQVVIKSTNPYVLPAGQVADLTFNGNTVDTPVADTALVGYYKVVASGNRIFNSGDMGLTFDNSSYVTATGNYIEAPHVGCMNISGAVAVTSTGNVCRNPARAYSQWNSIREPSYGGSWLSCMTVSLNSGALGVSAGVVITGNSCWMDSLPPTVDGSGGAIRTKVAGIAVDYTTSATPSNVVISGNYVYADEADMPGFFIQVATGLISYTASTGTPRVGELFKSSAGNQFRLIAALSNYVWMRDMVGFPLGSETYTGQSSGATLTIGASLQPAFQGVYLDPNNNRDYITGYADSYRGSYVLAPGASNTSAPTVAIGLANTGISSDSSGNLNLFTQSRGNIIKNYGLTVDRAVGTGFGGGGSAHDITFDASKGGSWYYLRGISSYLGTQSVDFWFDSNGVLSMPNIKATTGTRYVCIDTNGKITSSATACSGT